ncbi:MAG: ABC transporter ATP-binding protein [bacterium]|nr:ABC transporter ATP-binding protein [bacterium]
MEHYLAFAGQLKGIPRADIEDRVAEACARFELSDVRSKVIRTLSKGYRQRVGLAQAIINNPEVLVFDEPTSGLDPKQIIDTRSLIRNLAGDHTVILSTHILQAVERICDEVIVIHEGKLAAKDTVTSLRKRLLGVEELEIEATGAGDPEELRQKLEAIEGVAAASLKEHGEGRCVLEIESAKDHAPNGALARAVIDGGWNLHELRTLRAALEDIYLYLTGSEEKAAEAAEPEPTAESESGGEE